MAAMDQSADVNVVEEDDHDNCSLFLGDLSIFCDEKDIEEAFAQFGEIVEVRIQRSKETSRALSYGFIEFADPACAEAALNSMNYYLLKGRPLRIRWAASRKNPIKSAATPHDSAATVYVRFMSQSADAVVTEESLRELFNHYGPVFDCAIKKLSQDTKTNRTKGYAFISFDSGVLIHGGVDVAGVDAAYRAALDLRNRVVGNIRYRCELGYRLHKQYATMSQQAYAQEAAPMMMQMPLAGMVPVAVGMPQQQGYDAQGYAQQAYPPQSYTAAVFSAQYPKPNVASEYAHEAAVHQYQQQQQAQYQQQQVPQYQYTAMPMQQQHQQQPAAPQQGMPQEQHAPYQYTASPQMQQQQQQGSSMPSQQPMHAEQQAQYTYHAYPSYTLQSASFSPTAMVSQILSSNRSPTNYELQLLQAMTPRSTMPAQATAQPYAVHATAYGNPYMPAQVQQHQGYASSASVSGPTMVTPTHASNMGQGYHPQGGVPAVQYVAKPPQYAPYPYVQPTSLHGTPHGTPHSTPTHAHPEGGLRARTVSSDASSMGYAPTASMVMSMPMVMMPLTTGGQGMPQMTPINVNRAYPANQPQYPQQQGQGQAQPGKAYSPPTPRGSCSEYFNATKGLDLRVSTAPVSAPPAHEPAVLVHQLHGSRDSTPKSIYSTRKTTPGARKTMYDVRAQQLQMQEQMMASPPATTNEACKPASRRGSNESVVTTSLYLGSPSMDEADDVKGVSSESTEVLMKVVE